jgi:hypothetical protein
MFTLSTILIFDIGTVPTAWYCFSFYVSTFIGTVPTAWYCFSFYVSTFIGTVPTASQYLVLLDKDIILIKKTN